MIVTPGDAALGDQNPGVVVTENFIVLQRWSTASASSAKCVAATIECAMPTNPRRSGDPQGTVSQLTNRKLSS